METLRSKNKQMIKVELEKQKHEKGRYRSKEKTASRFVNTRFIADDFERVKNYCEIHDLTYSQFIRKAAKSYLSRHETEQKETV